MDVDNDLIRLRLPADPAYGRLARITAAGLALRLGFGHRQVQDLRIAVDEAMVALLDPSGGAEGLTLRFRARPGQIEVQASAVGGTGDLPTDDGAQRLHGLVDGLVDEIEVDGPGRSLTLRSFRIPGTTREVPVIATT